MSVVLFPSEEQHYDQTIAHPIEFARRGEIGPDDRQALLRLYPSGRTPLWGVSAGTGGHNIRIWARIKPGDLALFYSHKRFFSSGRVTYTFVNSELAHEMWGSAGTTNGTWDYLIALDDIQAVDLSVSDFNTMMGYSEGARIQGVRVLDDGRSATVQSAIRRAQSYQNKDSFAEDGDDLFHEDENVGAESESDVAPLTQTYLRGAYVTGSDWTTSTLIDQLRRGNIDLNPRFQRREVWQPVRKSSFIESVLLNFPIPQIVLAEVMGQRGRYIVLDGKQRLLTLRQFCSDSTSYPADAPFSRLSLRGLKLRPDLNGKDYADLRNEPGLFDDLDAFDNSTIRTVVVRNWQVDDYLYLVFLRLNTESVALSPQELRQALRPGRFTDFVDERAVESISLRTALNQSGPDFRMRDTEMLLRAVAFQLRPGAYRGNLKDFLDSTCAEYNSRWSSEAHNVEAAVSKVESAIELTIEIFGPRIAFSRYVGDDPERRFNRAIFDVLTYSLAQPRVAEAARENPEAVRTNLRNLCNHDNRFLAAITSTTKSLNATAYRFTSWAHGLELLLGTPVNVPVEYLERFSDSERGDR